MINSKSGCYGLCLSSALLLALPFFNHRFSLLSWFGLIPFFLALKDKRGFKSFLPAYFTGLAFWGLTVYWLVNVTLLGQLLLVLYLALYFGAFGFFYSLALPRYRVIFIPFLWVALEYGRSHLFTGFPWALLGYSQYANLAVIQFADIAGAWGVSFLIVLVNLLLQEAVTAGRRFFLFLAGILLGLILAYGFIRLGADPGGSRIRVSVIQGNIPQALKWDARARDFIMQRYFHLTLQAAQDNPDLIIWPEAALPAVLEEDPENYLKLRGHISGVNKRLLLGAVTRRDGLYYNSALLFSPDGELLGRYDKLHLVPFGEYIPFRNVLKFLETIAPIGDISRGREYTVFSLPAKFGVLICFEDVFPELARNFVRRGAGFLVNITNDAWFGRTPAAGQHLSASVFRAVENRVCLVRSANTGISAFISPSGRISALVSDGKEDIFIAGFRTRDIRIYSGRRSFYNRCGDVFPAFCWLVTLCAAAFGIFRRR